MENKLLASLWKAANQLIASHFQHTEGISLAPVVDRKSARVCITDQLSGFTMPIFKMVMETRCHVFKVQEKEELPRVSDEEWRQVVIGASAHARSAVVRCCAPSRAPPHLQPLVDGASLPLAGLPPLHFVVFLCRTPLTLLPQFSRVWRSVFFKRVLCCGLELCRQSCGLVALLLPTALCRGMMLIATLPPSPTYLVFNVSSGDGKQTP